MSGAAADILMHVSGIKSVLEPSTAGDRAAEPALAALENMTITKALLKETHAGKAVKALAKAGQSLSDRAQVLVEKWKMEITREDMIRAHVSLIDSVLVTVTAGDSAAEPALAALENMTITKALLKETQAGEAVKDLAEAGQSLSDRAHVLVKKWKGVIAAEKAEEERLAAKVAREKRERNGPDPRMGEYGAETYTIHPSRLPVHPGQRQHPGPDKRAGISLSKTVNAVLKLFRNDPNIQVVLGPDERTDLLYLCITPDAGSPMAGGRFYAWLLLDCDERAYKTAR